MMSTTGRIPVIAAPRPMPVKPGSEIGVSITRSGPNSSTRPRKTLNGVPASATSSPMTKTRGSRRISSASASRTASAIVSSRSATACSGIDMHGHFFRFRIWSIERELDAIGDLGPDLLFDAIKGRGIGLAILYQRLAEDLQRVVVLRPTALLVLGAVVRAVDIAHMMAVLPVGTKVQERRPFLGPCPFDRRPGRVIDTPHVLAVSVRERDPESGCPKRDVAGGRLLIVRVLVVHVVLADVDHGQLPQRGHVHALVDDALAERPLPEEARRDLVGAALPRRESRTRCNAGASRNDGVRAEVPFFLVGDVHRAALAPTVPGLLAQELGKHPVHAGALGQAVPMTAMGARDVVVVTERGAHPDRYRLLTYIKVCEPRHLGTRVEVVDLLLEQANAQHPLVEVQPGHLGRSGHWAGPRPSAT